MPGLVRTGHFSSGQGCQVRSGWSGQDRYVGPVISGQVWSGQINQVSSVWLGQVRSGLPGHVRSGYVSYRQVSSVLSFQMRLVQVRLIGVDQVTLAQVRSGLGRSVQVKPR